MVSRTLDAERKNRKFMAHREMLLRRKIDRNQRLADLAGPAVGSTRSRLTLAV
jgi:hypothetical protein